MPKSTRTTRSRTFQPTSQPKPSTTRQTRSRTHPYNTAQAFTKPKPFICKRPGGPFRFLALHKDLHLDPNCQTSLLCLPRELLGHIATSLPLVSLISLTLTCRAAAVLIGTYSWLQSKKEPWAMDREEFKRIFAKEWGEKVQWCEGCDTFHPPLPPPNRHMETKLTKRCFGQDGLVDYFPKESEGRGTGYSLVFEHIRHAMEESSAYASPGSTGPLISSLAGDYSLTRGSVLWRMQSAAQRVDGNLVLKHVQTFLPHPDHSSGKPLRAADALDLTVRLCPHQSTTTSLPERSRYIRGGIKEQNGPLLMHAINSSFPTASRATLVLDLLKRPAPSEATQIARAAAGEEVKWRCRACTTQYVVEHSGEGVVITSWHCFGRDLLHAEKYWKWLVRRTGTMLGKDKRNDEWWCPSRTVPDFICEA